MSLITPRTPPGTMELLPRRQIAFQRMLDTIRRGYERFGFLPVETPVFEVADVLLSKSGGETEKQVYFVQSTGAIEQGHRPDLALRFDLTVPLARYVAEHERDLAFPFRRYQMQRVYRGERAQKGRYREFYQCDIDVIGKDSLPVVFDAEMPAVIYTIFSELDVGPFRINFNNRKILLGLFESLGINEPETRALVLRQVDKLDKLSRDEVVGLLQGDGIGLDAATAGRVLDMIGFAGPAADTLAHLEGLGVDTPTFRTGLAELSEVVAALKAFGVPETHWRVNLAIARGLDYYTGTVYETFLTDHPGLGSVCSGGRYENLAGLYTKSKLPGVGISIGLTRLFYALEQAGIVTDGPSTVQVLVTQFDSALLPDYLAIGAELRAAGINTEIQLEPAKPKKQFAYADKAGIRFAVIMGPDEKARGEVTVKDMVSGEQAAVARAGLADWLRTRTG
ncbi:histidine--tRNA ligase [Rhodospirillum centenum]|uniref:Histidine--tRNA ligase n=1 Tax=Rhodospirillum centenum (strain ATCC 51521 / SW) TaxID=414684 RepID=B6IXA4_RHOCS|nr:histidine--tRNA ligase [Rhodospirillum centenum]ACJ00928.1 histidyl-tRNA synthetasehisS [Rhodospirillum centenum SW]